MYLNEHTHDFEINLIFCIFDLKNKRKWIFNQQKSN